MINVCKAIDCVEAQLLYKPSANSCLSSLDSDLICPSGENCNCIFINEEPGLNQDIIVSDYLRSVRRSGIQEALQLYINQHKELTQARTLIDNLDITVGLNYFSDKVQKTGRFVGIEIKPSSSQTIAVMIRKMGVQFDTLNTNLKFYFYETSQEDAIKTFTISAHSKTNSLQWFALADFIASYKYEDGGTGQRFILGYYENDLQGQALDTRLYTNCCGNEWVTNYQAYVWFRGCIFPPAALNGIKIPDMKLIGYTDQSFGIHLKASIHCDITETICDNVEMFLALCKKKIALKIFWDFYNNMNLNRKAELSRDRALPNITRLEGEFNAELKGLKLDLTELDTICAPCSKGFISSVTMR
jgi:hypothetical protein